MPHNDAWMVPYATGYPPGPAVMVEPRASCLTCRVNVAVTSSGRLRRHLDRRRPYDHGRQNWCKGARL